MTESHNICSRTIAEMKISENNNNNNKVEEKVQFLIYSWDYQQETNLPAQVPHSDWMSVPMQGYWFQHGTYANHC